MTQRVITLFGATGFLGRQVVQQLARTGAVLRIATRDPHNALHLKTAGAVGQIVPVHCKPWDTASVTAAVMGADAVVNLIGILFEKGKNTFERSHVTCAATIARTAAAAGVKSIVHLSAIGADAGSDSLYARTKAAGEIAVRAAFPSAVILRPSIIFGPEDNFFNQFARLAQWAPALPLIGGGHTKFQPVYVADVAAAVVAGLSQPTAAGQTFELGGPGRYTFRHLLEFMRDETHLNCALVNLPVPLARIIAAVMEWLPKPMITRDQIKLLARDNMVAGRALTLESLGITPTAMEAIVPEYLAAYRPGGRFAALEAGS